MEEILLHFALKYKGDFKSILKALQDKEAVSDEQRKEALETVKSKFTTIVSSDYPECFKQIDCPPFVVFYHGDLSLLETKTIAIIGNRDISNYGQFVTQKFAGELSRQNWTVVSGLALGVDVVGHKAAINSGGKTIAVLASGINYCYPKRHQSIYEQIKAEHLVLSEHPGDYVPGPQDFLNRNRLIAGAGDCLLVTEAKLRSGTMTTVGYCLDQGKEVYCIPGRIDDHQGCNILIQQGATMVMEVKDILEDKRIY